MEFIDKLRQVILPPKRSDSEGDWQEYEYCPYCDANLLRQKGYDPSLSHWVCLGCGQMLVNPAIETENEIAWICDDCGKMLNIQPGFNEECGEWTCTECGCVNKIDESQLYMSEDEYYSSKMDPYKGLSDEDVLALSLYEDDETIPKREDIIIVRDRDSDKRYIKKLLFTYDRSIYEYLKDHPIAHMPKIFELYESDNCLIVIEEYVIGKTVAEIMEEAQIRKDRAISIAKDICIILENLHGLDTPIIHRDVKPSNIMITDAGETYLLDMNVARWFDPEKNDDTTYMGTQSYAAPEQAGFGLISSSGKTDIYAVGMLLNVMITGAFPKQQRATGRIWDVIEKCISMDAEDRYSASELITALEEIED